MARAMELDERISYDGGGSFNAIPDGIWPATVKAVAIENYNGSKNIPACRNAKVTLRVGYGVDMTDATDNIYLYYNDNGNPNWRIAAFYRAIGYKKHGEEVQMNWSEGFLVGKTLWVKTTQREFTFTQGPRKGETGISIDIDYIDPEDAPRDGMPILKDASQQPQQQAMPQPVVTQPIQQPTYQPQPQYAPVQPTVTQPNVYGGGQWAGL